MRDSFPKKCRVNECGVINLDNSYGPGTHWCAYTKKKNACIYFDSFGDLRPPEEFIRYLGTRCKILYNYERYQNSNTFNCGHLCLEFLYNVIAKNQ